MQQNIQTEPMLKKNRFDAIDMSRGVIMILMALDHAVFFILRGHPMEYWGRPMPVYSTILPMLTRLTAHFCAPGFYFLMGISLVLFYQSRKSHSWSDHKIIRSLMLRGGMLIFLQLSIVNLAWYIGSKGSTTILGEQGPAGFGGQVWVNLDVLYGLGISMIVLSLLVKVPKHLLLFLSLGSFICSNVLFPSITKVDVAFSPLLRMLLIPGQTESLLVNYPLLPWVSIALFGMWIGKHLVQNEKRTFKLLALIGFCFLAAFIGLSVISQPLNGFFALTKYPPSTTYVLLTVGGNLLMLWLFSFMRHQPTSNKILIVFGRNALIFYITHLYIYALVGKLVTGVVPFYSVYIFTAFGLIPLYYICKIYMRFKVDKSVRSIWRLI